MENENKACFSDFTSYTLWIPPLVVYLSDKAYISVLKSKASSEEIAAFVFIKHCLNAKRFMVILGSIISVGYPEHWFNTVYAYR